jgi:hypothetical protein
MSLVLPLSSKSNPPPRLITADGTVENPSADLKQWELFQTVEQLHCDTSNASTVNKQIPPKDPRHVLKNIIAARSEIDGLSEMLTMVQQQQYLLVEHITAPPPSHQDTSHAAALRMLTKRHQLSTVASKLQQCATQLASRKAKDDVFLGQLKELRGRWKLKQRTRTAMFYADLSLPIKGYTMSQDEQASAEVDIMQDSNGDACILTSTRSKGREKGTEIQQRDNDDKEEMDVIIHRGPVAIHQALYNQQQLLKWKVIENMINNDAYNNIDNSSVVNGDDDISKSSNGSERGVVLIAGLQHLAQMAVLKRVHIINKTNTSEMDIDGEGREEERPSSYSYLEVVNRKMYELVSGGEVQEAFEKQATKHLVAAIESPLSLFRPPKAPNLVKPLKKWLVERTV